MPALHKRRACGKLSADSPCTSGQGSKGGRIFPAAAGIRRHAGGCAKGELQVKLQILQGDFSVCKLKDTASIRLDHTFSFVGKTDEEISLVCWTQDAPEQFLAREDGWRAFRIQGELDFSLVGILSRISSLLAAEGIGIFALSTFNTDYILTKAENFPQAVQTLESAGYAFER